jgi:ubiquinone/menaquinone biosynthesis C-methylase UbiE
VNATSTHAGQAVYSPLVLTAYDFLVLGVSNRLIWRCPSSRLLAHYDRHVSDDHLDVGVGTGWFLDRCRFPVAEPTLTLLDLNPNSLAHCAQRVGRLRPQTIEGDVLGELELPRQRFGSIAINYLLHCLPGEVSGGKWRAIHNLAPSLRAGGVLFGSTILGSELPRNFAQRRLMAIYNRKGIFGNEADSRAALEQALREVFEQVEIEQVGVVALFSARDPRK